MQGTTDRSSTLTVAPEAPPGPAFRVLAEVAAWFEQHQDGAPPLGDRTISLPVQGGTHAEKMQSLWAVARFLQTRPAFRHGVWYVQHRFGGDGSSITLDAHYTPDHDEAFRHLQQMAGVSA